jgi:hypothetical protein
METPVDSQLQGNVTVTVVTTRDDVVKKNDSTDDLSDVSEEESLDERNAAEGDNEEDDVDDDNSDNEESASREMAVSTPEPEVNWLESEELEKLTIAVKGKTLSSEELCHVLQSIYRQLCVQIYRSKFV